MEMVKTMSNCLTKGKVAKIILLVLVLFTLILTISPQNALAEETRRVNASEILDKIEKGELVDEDSCTIIGDLDLSKINLSTIKVDKRDLRKVNNSVSIKNSIIKGNVNFNDIYFNGSVNFDGTNFTGGANFGKSVFSSSSNFENIIFGYNAYFDHAFFNNKLDFYNVTFEHDAYFIGAIFNNYVYFVWTNFSSNTKFDNAYFNKGVQFTLIVFNGEVDFSGAIFNDDIQFSGTVFNNKTYFQSAVFDGHAIFGCEFKNYTDFHNATFNSIASFNNKKFKGGTNFNKAHFNDGANFYYTNFYKIAQFNDSVFKGQADFRNANFYTESYFHNSNFNDKAQFDHAKFNEPTSFCDATFTGLVDFEDARFMKDADFSNAEFNDEANFQEVIFNGTAEFSLAKFKERSFFLNALFKKDVDFTGTYILLMNIEWSQLEGKLVFDDYFYQSLIRNFENLGLFGDADDAYYEYRKIKQSQKEWGDYTKYTDAFSECICGYGVIPLSALIWAGIIIGLFSALYWWIEVEDRLKKLRESLKEKWNRLWVFVDRLIKGKENKKLGSDSSLKDKLKRFGEFFKDRGKRTLKFLFLSVSIFTTLGKWTNWKPAEGHETWFHFFVIIEVFLGWIIMVLFVISLTMTWIR